MCETGVKKFVEDLSGQHISVLGEREWCAVHDGFGENPQNGPKLLVEACPLCNEPFPIVRRPLDSEAYNLPDAAVYQRLRLGEPCIALGCVTDETTLSRNPDKHPELQLRERWQALMWDVYQVAFVDVQQDGVVGEFCPAEGWSETGPPCELPDIVADLEERLEQARCDGRIPDPKEKSTATEPLIEEIITPLLDEYDYQFAGARGKWVKKRFAELGISQDKRLKIQAPGFWCSFYTDLLYRRQQDQSIIAIEVKVNDDPDHPINQPLKNLLHYNAVLNIRVPGKDYNLDSEETRELVQEAEKMLEGTDRVRFICIGSE